MDSWKGFSFTKLGNAFAELTKDMDNWKMPIHTFIHICDWDLMKAACEYHTGSSLCQVTCLDHGIMEVKANGYYLAVGA